MNKNFFDQKFVDQKVLITLEFFTKHFLTKNVSDPIVFSFGHEIFLPKDFVVLRPRENLSVALLSSYLCASYNVSRVCSGSMATQPY